ncbi:MAG: hypothetical protein Q8Q75_08805 [Rhodoferax sp.]|nr:hypothetical protein [Rhodoferax sp.]MDP3864803.1 hypothetical protein [Rhodoferax sp.]
MALRKLKNRHEMLAVTQDLPQAIVAAGLGIAANTLHRLES